MKIGLVGEAPNDTASIKNLLSKQYHDKDFIFENMLDNITGSQLDNKYTETLLRLENQFKRPDLIIFIRDLDSLWSDNGQRFKRKRYFVKNNNIVQRISIPLLHVYEIEALIFADIDTFNKMYGTTILQHENVSQIVEPKEVLLRETKYKYSESHNAKIFDKLNFHNLLECNYFKTFIENFEKATT